MKVYSINFDFNNNSIGNKQINFKRNWSEHVSWGANYLKKNGTTDFKLFSFPDAKSVFVEVSNKVSAQFGGIKDRIVKVAGIAGSALTIENITSKDNNSKVYKMEHKGNGIYEAKNIKSTPDDKYRYIVVDKNNNVNLVKDPYAKKQEDINGWSSIYNPDNYEWVNTDWIDGKDFRRVIRKPNEPLRGLDKLIIEEINIPTITSAGTFTAAKSYIDTIVEKGFANAIELMPVENTFSMQWGYDGVDKFAVNEKLGGAKDLKELIDYAHGKGLNVIMDMVPNHMGPDGDYLSQTGPYERGAGQFGGELNYEGKDNRYVRDWMTNAALWWANEFKVDGLRLDMTKCCGSDYLLKQIVSELNEHNPNVFIIAEDGRENKDSVTRYEDQKAEHNDALDFIDTQVKFIAEKGWHSTPGNIGFDSEWDFRLMHTVKNAILDSGANLLEDLDNKILGTQYRIKYVMSHDEIGNEDGTRLIPKVMCRHLNLFLKTDGYNDADKGQKAAHASQKLSELVVSKDFERITDESLFKYEKSLGLNSFISKEELITAFKTAIAKNKLALGTVMTIPGPTMFFQGDDRADLSYFKFFREFSGEKYAREHFDNYKSYIISQKGYDTYITEARADSLLGRVKPAGMFKNLNDNMSAYTSQLKQTLDTCPSLKSGQIVGTYKDNNHNVHIHHTKLGTEETLVIKNYGQGFHDKNYAYYGFPENSTWEEVFNSDDTLYGGSGFTNSGRNDITNHNQKLSLAPNSFLILRKVS